MVGPCLCGDPYCPNCGTPGLARAEAAENQLAEALYEAMRAGLTVEDVNQLWAQVAEDVYYDEVKDQQEEAAYEARIAEAERAAEAQAFEDIRGLPYL
jgi:hypothetical protein